jgi:hypothetical protein
MNTNNNGKSGFKSLVLVAAFLAIVGSLIYSSNNVDSLENNQAASPTYKTTQAKVANEQEAEESPFKKLAEQKPDTQSPAVLQAATGDDDGTLISGTDSEGMPKTGSPLAAGTGPQSTPSVPSTGTTSVTMALIFSSMALAFGFFVMAKNPRKVALARFEKKISKKL